MSISGRLISFHNIFYLFCKQQIKSPSSLSISGFCIFIYEGFFNSCSNEEKKLFTALKFLRVSGKKKLFYVGALMYRYFALQIFIIFLPRFQHRQKKNWEILYFRGSLWDVVSAECSFQSHKTLSCALRWNVIFVIVPRMRDFFFIAITENNLQSRT